VGRGAEARLREKLADETVASADAALAALAGRCRTLAEALRVAALAYEHSDEAAAERLPVSGRAV